MKQSQSLVLFHQNTVRRHWDGSKELWYFSIVDVVQILTDSTIPRRYWSDLKKKLQMEGSEVYEKIVQLKMIAPDGKQRETDCLSTEDLFRVIQSIPSPKAEPFKLWLAEASTAAISKKKLPKGLPANRQVARQGGMVAGKARTEIEKRTGESVITGSSLRVLPANKPKK